VGMTLSREIAEIGGPNPDDYIENGPQDVGNALVYWVNAAQWLFDRLGETED